MATKRYMAQVLCAVLGYNFKFLFQVFITQVSLQLEVKVFNLVASTLGLNSMEKDLSMVVSPLSSPHET